MSLALFCFGPSHLPWRWALAVVCVLLAAVSPAHLHVLGVARAQAAPDLQVILAGDTDDSNIGEGCVVDLKNMADLFSVRPQGKTVNVVTFSGKNGNFAQNLITKHIQSMPLSEKTGVVFYFTGHGSYSNLNGHQVRIPPTTGQKTADFPNEQVLNTLASRKAPFRQLIVITDSCAPNVDVQFKARGKTPNVNMPSRRAEPDPAVIGMLFYQAQGVVNLNGCSEHQYAYGPSNIGGLFTVGMLEALSLHRNGNLPGDKLPDGNQDGFLTWREFFPTIVQATESNYITFLDKHAAGKAPAGPDNQPQTKQTPQAYVIHNFDEKKDLLPKHIFGAGMVPKKGGGAEIVQLLPNTPAADKLKVGDVIRRVNKMTVRGPHDFAGVIDFATNRVITINISRGDQDMELEIELQVRGEKERRK